MLLYLRTMSNLGKKMIYKPEALTLELQKFGNAYVCWFSGSYYTLKQRISNKFTLNTTGQKLSISPPVLNIATTFYKTNRTLINQEKNKNWSLTYVKINQSIIGALVGFKNFLRVRGVGYKFQIIFNRMTVQAGHSHLLEIKMPYLQSLSLNKKSTFLRLKSSDVASLTNFLSSVRNLRQPDVYKGKGIRYRKDFVLRKEGKKKKST